MSDKQTKDVLEIKFKGKALEQLEHLRHVTGSNNPTEVIGKAISAFMALQEVAQQSGTKYVTILRNGKPYNMNINEPTKE